MKRERPKRVKEEMKQVHFDMNFNDYIEFEKVVYSMGYTVSDYFRKKAMEVINK